MASNRVAPARSLACACHPGRSPARLCRGICSFLSVSLAISSTQHLFLVVPFVQAQPGHPLHRRRCFGRAAQISHGTATQTCLGKRRDVELQIPSYQRRLHSNTAFQYQPEAVIPQSSYPAPQSPGRWMWASVMEGS